MGFATSQVIGAAATAVDKTMEAVGGFQQSRELRRTADEQAKLAAAQAEKMTATALKNHQRGQRNAALQLSQARADAGAANTVREGSTLQRETDLATRLEDELTAQTTAALQDADNLRMQGAMEAWNLKQQASAAKTRAVGSLLGGAGGALNQLYKK